MINIQKVILGTAQFGLHYGINNKSGQPKEKSIFEILDHAYSRGVRILDTAEDYGNAHSVIGLYMRNHPSRFLIISKMSSHTTSPRVVMQKMEDELAALHVSKLEAYLFHKFENLKKFPHLINAMVSLRDEGKIGKIGASIYSNGEFVDAINNPRIEVIQLPFNLLDNSARKNGLLQKAKEAGKEIHARSVFMQGLFFMEEDEIPVKLNQLVSPLAWMKALARDAEISLETLAFNYVVSNHYIDKVLFGVDSLEQLTKSLDSLADPVPQGVLEQVDLVNAVPDELLNPTNWK